jgi:hypothetical protein
MKIPKILIATDFNGTPTGGADTKKAFHTAGKAFLRSLAKELGNTDTCDIRSCLGGPAVLGEVILHSEKLYVSIFEHDLHGGVRVLYRTCRGRQDFTGGMNRYASLKGMSGAPEQQEAFIAECRRIEVGLITA